MLKKILLGAAATLTIMTAVGVLSATAGERRHHRPRDEARSWGWRGDVGGWVYSANSWGWPYYFPYPVNGYGYGPDYSGCYLVHRPLYTRSGYFIRYTEVQLCR